MPVVTVQLWEGRSPEQKRSLVTAITRAMVDFADADPSGLHVVLQEVPPHNWARAGVLGSDRPADKASPAPRIIGLSHLLLQVRDLIDAERFYVHGLGFTVRKRESLPDGRDLIVLDQGMGLTAGGPEPPGPVEHIAFQTRSVASFVERIEAAGGRILGGPQPGAYGISLYFTDPDGNKLEFHGD
ncbi:MAG: tautomerase family protein [Actinomycetota bacterium]